ncbi:MAG: hypothetical protein JSW52_00395 [Candidatus Coatesbacteria bacterium]|nr:MAG: hypothetical protein JSW52_00395 [Candidatus Coatesbacteria bacterium]
MKAITIICVLLAAFIWVFDAGAEEWVEEEAPAIAGEWDAPIGPDYGDEFAFDEMESLRLIRSYYREGSYVWALETAKEYLKRYPGGKDRPEVEYIIIRCRLNQGEYGGVLEGLERIMSKYSGTWWAIEAADLYVDLFSEAVTPWDSSNWAYWLADRFDVYYYDYDNPKMIKARKNALKKAEKAYVGYMKKKSGAERDELADRNVNNYMKMMGFVVFDTPGDPVETYNDKVSYVKSALDKEMSRDMRSALYYYIASIIAEDYYVDPTGWDEDVHGDFYAWADAKRFAVLEEYLNDIAGEYDDAVGGIAAKAALANYAVVYHNDPRTGANEFDELASMVDDRDYAEFFEELAEGLRGPALAITNVETEPGGTPDVRLEIAAKLYDEVEVNVYPVDRRSYYDTPNELNAVDLFLKDGRKVVTDIDEFYREGHGEKIRAHGIDYVEPRPSADLPGVGDAVISKTAATGYAGDLRITTFAVDIYDLEPGLYILEVKTEDNNMARAFFAHSEAVAVYATDDESLFFEIVDPENGEPVPVENIYSFNEYYGTDESGYNRRYREEVKLKTRPAGGGYVADLADLELEGRVYIVAETARGPAFLEFQPPSGESDTDKEIGIIYTDRPLYRPEQAVGFKAVLRYVDFQEKVLEPVVEREVNLKLKSPMGDEIWTGDGVTDEYGALWGSIKLPPGAPLGTYDLYCEWVVLKEIEGEPFYPDKEPFRGLEEIPVEDEVLVEEKRYYASWSFDLEEYEKPEYEVTVFAEKDRYLSGETVRVVVEGRYFFGSPMANAYVEYEVYRSGNIDDEYGYEYYSLKEKGEGHAGKDGRYIIEFPSEYAGVYDNYYQIEVKVTDESNHVIDEYYDLYTFRSDLFVDLEVDKYSYYPGDTVELSLNTYDWYDAPVSIPVSVTFYEYEWVPYEGYAKGEVLYSTVLVTDYDGTKERTLELPRVITTDEMLITCVAEDAYGTEIRDSTTVSIVPEEEVTVEKAPEVEIIVDDDHPTLGDTITATVRSRFEGVTASIMFFSDRVANFENVILNPDPDGGSSARFDILVDDRFLPTLRLKAVIVKDGVYYEDTAYVEITNVNTHMNIAVELGKGEYRPGDMADATVICTDYDGLPVEANLSLSGVDVSLLALRSDRTNRLPDSFRSALYREFYPYTGHSLDVINYYSDATYLFRYYKGYYGATVGWPDTTAEEFLSTISLPKYVNPTVQEFIHLSGIDLLNPKRYDYMTVWETVKGPVAGTLIAPVVEIGAGKGMEMMEITDEAAEVPEDPLEREGYPRAPAVPTSETFGDVFVGRGATPEKITIDGKEYIQTRLRTYFTDSAYWKPDIYTDKNGEIEVNLIVPDNLTTWKFIALGVDKGQRIGWDYATCNVTKNVLVRLVTPRHMVVGDTARIKAIVHNYLSTDKEFAVAIDLDNVMLAEGSKRTFRSVDPGDTFAFEQSVWADRPGDATFTAIALSDVESDAMTKTLKVYPHGIVKRQSFCGRLRESVEHEFTIDDRIDPDTFDARLIMAPSIAYLLSQGLDFFEEYPYDCVEQASNRFLVNALLADVAGKLGLDESELAAGLTEAVDEGIATLAEAQTEEGGWPWWKGGKTSPYMTAYVLDGLLTIQGNPFLGEVSAVKVDNMVLPATRDLNSYLFELRRSNDREDWELSLYVADVLLRHGLTEPGNEIILDAADYYFDKREVKSDRGLVLLGSVLYYTGQEGKLATVLRNLDNGAKVGPDRTIYWGDDPGYCWYWWQDSVETTAKVLDLKMLAQPESEQIPHMIDWLVDQRRGAAWKSTKDSAEATKTLIRYLLKYPEVSERVVVGYEVDGTLEDKLLLEPTEYEEPEATVTFDINDFDVGANSLKLTRYKGTSPVFYTAAVKYYTEAEEIAASEGSVTIERDYYVIERKLKKGRFEEERVPLNRPLAVGEELEVEITINSPYDFDFVVIEDPRPAGCIYTEMASGYDWWLDAYVELKTEKRAVLIDRLYKGETKFSYRLRAEIPGDYAALPASVYGMYSPDIGSNTASTRVEVVE